MFATYFGHAGYHDNGFVSKLHRHVNDEDRPVYNVTTLNVFLHMFCRLFT